MYVLLFYKKTQLINTLDMISLVIMGYLVA